MNSNLDKIALDLYGKIQTRFPNIKIGDENATVLSKKEDIPNARFFEFEYEENGEPLGTIAITLDTDDGIVVQVSGDLVNDDDNTTHHNAYKFIRSFRSFAKDRLLNFDVQNIGKSNMDKRDYQFQAKRKELPMEPIMENKMYGTAKISYQDLGENARLVVKHNQPINLDLAAGRTMHIEGIYIENAVGERFKYPFKHLNGARALAEHIKAGGNPYDGIGKHITSLSEELAQLRKFKGYVNRQEQLSEAMGDLTSVVMERIDSIKKEIHSLQRPSYYQQFAESFQERETQMIPEDVMNDWIDRLTIRTFNEELKSVFPYIYNIMDEAQLPVVELGAEDLLAEGMPGMGPFADANAVYQAALASFGKPGSLGAQQFIQKNQISDPSAIKAVNQAGRDFLKNSGAGSAPEEQFESFIDKLMQEDNDLLSPNKDAQQSAIEQLNKIMSQELKGGPEGINAIQSLKGLIDDPEFLGSLRDVDPDLDVRPLIQQYVLANAPEVAVQLHFGGEAGGAKEAEAPPPPPPAPPAPAPAPMAPPPEAMAGAVPPPEAGAVPPMAESEDDKKGSWRVETPWKKTDPKKNPEGKVHNLAGQALKKTIEKAKKAGATLETQLDFGSGVKTLAEIIDECGMTPQDVGFEGEQQESGVEQILKSISGFWNAKERNFTIGGTRAKTKVLKDFKDGEFPNATPDDVKQVIRMIEKMDPSNNEHNQIMRLSGIPQHSQEVDEQSPAMDPRFDKLTDLVNQLQSKMGTHGGTSSSTQSGTINGQNANYDDVMNQFKNMKLKFGDDEIDFSNPDQAGEKIKGVMGGMMKGVQGQMPNQNVQFPGGQMNPADMMKDIMGKINFGK